MNEAWTVKKPKALVRLERKREFKKIEDLCETCEWRVHWQTKGKPDCGFRPEGEKVKVKNCYGYDGERRIPLIDVIRREALK